VYCYVAIHKQTGVPIAGGPHKYNLRHAIEANVVLPENAIFYRIRANPYSKPSEVTELTLEEVLKRN
jgi:tRNA splicing ligase